MFCFNDKWKSNFSLPLLVLLHYGCYSNSNQRIISCKFNQKFAWGILNKSNDCDLLPSIDQVHVQGNKIPVCLLKKEVLQSPDAFIFKIIQIFYVSLLETEGPIPFRTSLMTEFNFTWPLTVSKYARFKILFPCNFILVEQQARNSL